MSLTLGALRELVSFGLTAEQILAVAEAQGDAPPRSLNAERQARFRARRNAESNAESNVTSNVTVLSLPPETKVSPTPPSKTQTSNPIQLPPIVPHSKAIGSRRKGDFEKFWAEYPLKVGKLKAGRCYATALGRCESDDPEAEIIEGLRRCKPLWEPEFIPHASTWLNRGGWLDQLVPDLPEQDTGKRKFDLADFEARRAARGGER